MTDRTSSESRIVWQILVGFVLVSATLWPVTWSAGQDSFPLSSYPMFARNRPRVLGVARAVLVKSNDEREVVAPRYVGSDEVLQVATTIRRAIRSGDAGDLCVKIADRFMRAHDSKPAASEDWRIEIVKEWIDTVAYFQGNQQVKKRRTYARCPL